MYEVNSLITRTDVTSVKFNNTQVLAGIGGKLFVFIEDLTHKKTIELFNGQQIFGIISNSSQTECLIYGENQLKILNSENDYKEISSSTFDEWILSAKWINFNNKIATISMHNNVSLWTKSLKLLQTVQCAERCILYSAHLVNNSWEDLIVLSGTVFSQILLWRPEINNSVSSVLARLDGHKGVIFSIDYNQSIGIICSTSDDRSARLWNTKRRDLTEELNSEKPEITLKCTMFCHTARVFRCLVLDNCVLTTGEDSLLVVWDFEGVIMRKLEIHQGASVWSLDYNKINNVVVTGGGDSGITLFPLQQYIEQQQLAVGTKQILKRTAILNNGDIVCISESGTLVLKDSEKDDWLEIHKHDDLTNYCLLEVSRCRNMLALAGYHGSIRIYKLDKRLIHICTHKVLSRSRIFALHWISSNQYLTCELEGVLQVWSINDEVVTSQDKFILPSSKERWTTTACICNDGHLAVGDRKGNIYVFIRGNLEPQQILKKAHNYLGVTNLYFKNDVLISLGRNSTVKTYQFDNSTFSTLSVDKLPFSWLTSIYKDGNDQFLLAFLGNEFIVWDYKKRRTLIQFQCGGGHRSWDFHKINDKIKFAFIKDNCVNLIEFNSTVLDTKDLIEGFHFNEINSAVCIPCVGTVNTLLISGGEDTTLRVSNIEYGGEPKFETKSVFKSHLSSVRTITACKIKSESELEEYLVLSAGGRAQIILWELKIFFKDEGVVPICSEKYSHYEQLLSEECETRIMDLCTIVVNAYIMVVAATSGGTLKVFRVTIGTVSYKMELVGEVVYKLKCILKLKYFTIHQQHLILSTATDGNVVFWDFTHAVNNFERCSKETIKNIDIITSINLHVSGINSFDYKIINETQCVLLTGGDDNTIKVSLISFDLDDAKLTVKVLSCFTDSESHCAQITGTFLNDNYFVTTSIDQKLVISTWKVEKNLFVCKSKQVYSSNIADIQGMQSWTNDDVLYVTVYGKGIELYQIKENRR